MICHCIAAQHFEMFTSNKFVVFFIDEDDYVLTLNGWEVTEGQMEAIPNGCWIGSEVHCMCLGVCYYSYYNCIIFKVISFFMKLLELELSMAIRTTRSKKISVLLSTYFYQRWALEKQI